MQRGQGPRPEFSAERWTLGLARWVVLTHRDESRLPPPGHSDRATEGGGTSGAGGENLVTTAPCGGSWMWTGRSFRWGRGGSQWPRRQGACSVDAPPLD